MGHSSQLLFDNFHSYYGPPKEISLKIIRNHDRLEYNGVLHSQKALNFHSIHNYP